MGCRRSDTYIGLSPSVAGGACSFIDKAPDSAFDSGLDSKETAPRNEERIDEFKLSRSRALLLVLAEACRGELPFNKWDGTAEKGFGPRGGDVPEPITILN